MGPTWNRSTQRYRQEVQEVQQFKSPIQWVQGPAWATCYLISNKQTECANNLAGPAQCLQGFFWMLAVGIKWSCRKKYQTRQSLRAILQVVFNPMAARAQRWQAHISASHRLDESKIVDRPVGGPLHLTGQAISCQVGCGSCVLPRSLWVRLLGASLVSAFWALIYKKTCLIITNSISAVGFKLTSAPSTRQICLEEIYCHIQKNVLLAWELLAVTPAGLWTIADSFKAGPNLTRS